jgi:predicted aspartyl protease
MNNDKIILLLVLSMLLGVFLFVYVRDPNQNSSITAAIQQWITGILGAISALAVQARARERKPESPSESSPSDK